MCRNRRFKKKKKKGGVCLHLHALSVQPQLFPPFCSSVRHICRADSLSGVFSGPQKEGGLSSWAYQLRRPLLANVQVRRREFFNLLYFGDSIWLYSKTAVVMRKTALWVFCLNISRRGHYDSSSRSCLFTPCRFPDDRKRARQGLWLERFRSTSCRNQTPSLCHQLFFFFFDEQQTGWKTLKWSDYGSGSQSEAVEEKRRLRGNAVWKPEVRKR